MNISLKNSAMEVAGIHKDSFKNVKYHNLKVKEKGSLYVVCCEYKVWSCIIIGQRWFANDLM